MPATGSGAAVEVCVSDQRSPAPAPKPTPQKKGKFLKALTSTGSVTLAAKRAGLSVEVLDGLRESDTDFAERWRQAEALAIIALEMEARRRAVEGVEEPVFYQGQKIGVVRRYSDSLLSLLLRGNRPEKFRERAGDGDSGGMPIVVKIQNFDDRN